MNKMAQKERIVAINIPRPYGETEYAREMVGRELPKATRTQTLLGRYQLKEGQRNRVPGVESLTSRAQIGIKRPEWKFV